LEVERRVSGASGNFLFVAHAVSVCVIQACSLAIEIRLRVCATVVILCRSGSVVASSRISASVNLIRIAYSIIVDIRRTITSADAQRIVFISLAITIRWWNV
jgi:hypothetical protein